MANQQHIDWLLEGVEAWNARRERDDFIPDFEDANLKKILSGPAASIDSLIHDFDERKPQLEATNLSRAKLRGADLGALNLSDAKLQKADLRLANLEGAWLLRVNLTEANLYGANLSGAYLANSVLQKANLTGANLRLATLNFADLRNSRLIGVKFGGASLGNVDLRATNLQGVNLGGASLNGANFEGANVKTILEDEGRSEQNAPSFADLSAATGLTSSRLESMNGDSGTILPRNLSRPVHWSKIELPELNVKAERIGDQSNTASENARTLSETTIVRETIATRILENREPIIMAGAALEKFIEDYKEEVRRSNYINAEHPDFCDNLLTFLDDLSESVSNILGSVPAPGAELSEGQIDNAQKWTDRFVNAAVPAWKDHFAPEKLGNVSAPIGIILSCGAFGFLVSGFNPIGFGAGAVVGKLVTGEMKSGAAADKLSEQLENSDGPSE